MQAALVLDVEGTMQCFVWTPVGCSEGASYRFFPFGSAQHLHSLFLICIMSVGSGLTRLYMHALVWYPSVFASTVAIL